MRGGRGEAASGQEEGVLLTAAVGVWHMQSYADTRLPGRCSDVVALSGPHPCGRV